MIAFISKLLFTRSSLPIRTTVYCHRLQYTDIQCGKSETYCTGWSIKTSALPRNSSDGSNDAYISSTNQTQTSPGVRFSEFDFVFYTNACTRTVHSYILRLKDGIYTVKGNKISFINFFPFYSFVICSVRVRSHCEPQ